MTEKECIDKIREIINKGVDEKLAPYLAIYPREDVIAIYKIGIKTFMECGKYVEFKRE